QQNLQQQLSDLNKEYETLAEAHHTLTSTYEQGVTEQQNLQQQLSELNEEYQTLTESHHALNDEYSELLRKCEALEQVNQALLEKNRLAKEHTKVVMQRLTLIDQPAD
ncbi:MAG TPA: hypothetical protein DDW38_08705, partial [Psychrobacter sp.]|nr:hypothetical protein [Psychrobacter sp.]